MPSFQNNPKNIKNSQKILVMRYRFIGDTLLSVPFLRNLRRAYPEATIHLLVAPNSGEILKHCPYIDKLIYFDTTRKHRYEYKQGEKPRTFLSYVKELRKEKYHTAFVIKRSFSSAFLAYLAGIPNRIGYGTEARQFLLTQTVPYDKTASEIQCFLDVLRAVDIPVTDTHLESWWTETEEDSINRQVKNFNLELNPNHSNSCHVLFHMTSSNAQKEWPEPLFFHLAQWLIKTFDATIHCVGAASDAPRYQNLSRTLNTPNSKRFYNWCGKTNLLESLSLIKRMNLAIGVDSGTLHMASAVNVPVIGLFSPENITKWAPSSAQSIISERDSSSALSEIKNACQIALQQKTPHG